ncbi:hypothetical protein FBR02_00910 [Anaerolineae bacterium CFX9]|nr:hypothetical protein [Anaerolineae bacterium CFX9]
MTRDMLLEVQQLQFTDKAAAEARLSGFLREVFPLDITDVALRPLATSLNSFNGFLTLADGRRLFFKAHAESDTVIEEYYQAALLADAGYPVLQPIYSSTQVGRQILIYEVIEDPSVFDVSWEIESGRNEALLKELTAAQNEEDSALYERYRETLADSDAHLHAQAPVHQLFYHRITGGRFERFYGSLDPARVEDQTSVLLPDVTISLRQIRSARWEINGQNYSESIDTLIGVAAQILNPAWAAVTVMGHGDAHNGNVFLVGGGDVPRLMYFDPAFAGRHSPLLDITKPLFHNVFAMWMYYPHEKTATTQIHVSYHPEQNLIRVEHSYELHPVRRMFLESKVSRTLTPLLAELKRNGRLEANWRQRLKAALMCCPLLTMNLLDSAKFTPTATALGFAMTLEMGAESRGNRSLIDAVLDEVETALR